MALGIFGKEDALTKHRNKIRDLQQRQRENMAKVATLKEEGRDIQRKLDNAHSEFETLRKEVARESGVKISPVGVSSGEGFGEF